MIWGSCSCFLLQKTIENAMVPFDEVNEVMYVSCPMTTSDTPRFTPDAATFQKQVSICLMVVVLYLPNLGEMRGANDSLHFHEHVFDFVVSEISKI